MAVVKHTTEERDLLARLMRAEAIGEGNLGMLMVGNVGVNRTIANCLTFKNITTISKMVYQNPGGFSSTNSSLFFSSPTTKERQLADRVLKGEYFYPATNSLWFYAPARVLQIEQFKISRLPLYCKGFIMSTFYYFSVVLFDTMWYNYVVR